MSRSEQARATYQAGQVGNQLSGASDQIADRTKRSQPAGIGGRSDRRQSVRRQGQIKQAVGNVGSLVEALTYIQSQFGGNHAFGELDKAAKLAGSLKSYGATLRMCFRRARREFQLARRCGYGAGHEPLCSNSQACGAAQVRMFRAFWRLATRAHSTG